MAVLSIFTKIKQYVTKRECSQCREANTAKRATLEEMIKGIRREQRLGFTMVTIFIAIVSILLKTGVI